MPPNQREVRATQRRLMNKYKVKFVGPIESLREEDQPANHQTIVSHIRQLGRTDFEKYHESITVDANERPWREQIRRRAQRIAGLAKRCLEARKNETGWRMALESEVVARFTVEVACRKCRGRLWRSEQEVTAASADEEGAMPESRSLKIRQERRAPCLCRSDRHREDPIEQGINPLFDDLADEAIVYSDELRAELPKRDERPDRVYGLRRTQRLDRILSTQDRRAESNGKDIDETLRTSPFRPDGEPILFPFLIMEAKSEKGENSFTDIEVQTAFAIRELLHLQQDLRQAAAVGEDWEGGPLVWFLSNKGEQWRVSIGYMDVNKSEPRFLVARLWHGTVDSNEDALRLLLIIDYICDWARDIYRESVIQCLRSLIVGDSRSLAYDTDIFSTIDRIENWEFHGAEDDDAPGGSLAIQKDGDPLQAYDTPEGVIRDSRHLRMRFIALYITKDNVDYLLKSTKSELESKKMHESLSTFLVNAWHITKEGLDDLEAAWTGKSREGTDAVPPEKKFVFTCILSAYISPDWRPTLELACIAVVDDLWDLFDMAPLEYGDTRPSHGALVGSEELQSTFLAVLKNPISYILFGCFKRVRFLSLLPLKIVDQRGVRVTVPGHRPTTDMLHPRLGKPMLNYYSSDKCGKVHDFISIVYRRHKIGRQDPSSSIFRLSSGVHKYNTPQNRQDTWHRGIVSKFHLPREKDDDLIFAVSSKTPAASLISGNAHAKQCIYAMNPAAISPSLRENISRSISARQAVVQRFDHHSGWVARGWGKGLCMTQEEDHVDLFKSYLQSLRGVDGFFAQKTDDDSAQVEGPQDEESISTDSASAKRAIIVIHDSDSEEEQAQAQAQVHRRKRNKKEKSQA